MKTYLRIPKFFVIFLILSSTICAYGQNNPNFLLDSTASYVSMTGSPGGASVLGKSKYFYDNQNQVIQIRQWGTETTGATPYYFYYYYTNKKLTSIEAIKDNEVTFKATISYDAQGLTADSITQTAYNNIPLKNDAKYSYDYDASGRKTVDAKYLWSEGAWMPNTRTTYVFDSKGRMSEKIYEQTDGAQLVLSSKSVYSYDESDKLIEELGSWYNGTWENRNSIKYIYEGNLLKQREYYRTQTSVSVLGNVDSLFYTDNLLTLENKYSISNDTYYKTASIKKTYDKNNLLVLFERIEQTLDGPLTYTTYYFYIPKPTGVEEEPNSDISVSPNPAYDQITISVKPSEGFEPSEDSEILIYNALGEKIMTVGAGRDLSEQINISDLPKGMYFVRIGGVVAKFVKM